MKNLSICMFVFSLCMFGHVSGAGIRIANELKFKKNLWMRCYSKDDVLGLHIIPIGGHFLDYFGTNFWGTTRFMCTLRQGPNYRHYQSFTAFKLFSMEDHGGLWDWRAREDGIYLKKEVVVVQVFSNEQSERKSGGRTVSGSRGISRSTDFVGASQNLRPFVFLDDDAYGYMYGIRNTLLSRAKDGIESHMLQYVIAKGLKETIDKIFDNLISHVCELMLDYYGHKVFRKLMEKCTDEQITRVLDIVLEEPFEFVRLCVHTHGTHAIQGLMRSLCSEEQISRFMETLCYVSLLLTKDVIAHRVILFCFNQFSPSHTRYLLEVIVQNCYQVAIDQNGCCMLKKLIRQSSRELRDPLIKEIISIAVRLCGNCYGTLTPKSLLVRNYVVQYLLRLKDYEVTSALSKHLDGNYVQLSYDKYGSHVVQKCLESREFSSRRIIAELLSDIDSLLVDPYGDYVIQTA
ncbi:putative plant self-incompatibility S1, armadillo-like helical, pumilio domain-containing protein [Arabidopsis thaliana]